MEEKKSYRNRLIREFYELKIKDLMDRRHWDTPIIEKDADVSSVFSVLSGRGHVWVVDNKKSMKLVGVITEHDVLSLLSPPQLTSYVLFGAPDLRALQYGLANTAGDIMSKKPIVCYPEDSILDVLSRMGRYKIRRLPVVENGKLIGEITLRHLICKYYAATQYHPIIRSRTDKSKEKDS